VTFSFGDIVRVVVTSETFDRGIAGGVGMVVSVNVTSAHGGVEEVIGGAAAECADLDPAHDLGRSH
jgi:hypothetical protein